MLLLWTSVLGVSCMSRFLKVNIFCWGLRGFGSHGHLVVRRAYILFVYHQVYKLVKLKLFLKITLSIDVVKDISTCFPICTRPIHKLSKFLSCVGPIIYRSGPTKVTWAETSLVQIRWHQQLVIVVVNYVDEVRVSGLLLRVYHVRHMSNEHLRHRTRKRMPMCLGEGVPLILKEIHPALKLYNCLCFSFFPLFILLGYVVLF